MYPTLRTIHLLCGAFALPMLLMYGVSAVQMAHTKWFSLTPVISESTVQLSRDYSDGPVARARVNDARRCSRRDQLS